MLSADDIAEIFEWIEMLLIGSLKRNLTRHEAEEKKYGFNWSAWQAEKLRNVNRFRHENAAIMSRYTEVIDRNTRALLEEQFREGVNGAAQEAGEAPEPQPVYMQDIQPTQPELPEQAVQPEQPQEQPTPETTEQVSTGSPAAADEPIAVIKPEPQFFGVDTVKVNKLVEDMTTMEKQAETAALRMTDDVYRQTLNRVQLAMSTGSMTLQKAIDTAVEDFLNAGINCIEYKDGRRVNIADYVRMALRTTSTRAALQGHSEKLKALGYDTVAVSSYGMCSPTCLPYQGRVYINDAFTSWSGETQLRADGLTYGKSNYCGKWFPLLSSAIAGGLFHPNCRHGISMWRDGDPLPETLDNSETERRYKLEQQQRALEREIRKAKRKVEGFTDPENIAMAKAQQRAKEKELQEHIDKVNEEYGKPNAPALVRDSGKEKIYKEVKLNSLDDRGIKKESYDSNSAPPQPKQDAPQAMQEDNEGNSSTKQNSAVQSSTEGKKYVNNTSLDNSDNGGIIKETEDKREFEPLPPEKVVPVLRKDSEEWINNLSSEEVRAVKKYTKNSGDPDDDKFFARLNAMLRGDIPEDETLNYYSSVISGAISKFELQHDIVCYRAVEFNPVEGLKVGDVYKPKQFLSSSVSTAGALNGKYFLKIFAPKGGKGAYIELLSKYPKQREFLFDKDLNYNVLAVNGNIITVEAIV